MSNVSNFRSTHPNFPEGTQVCYKTHNDDPGIMGFVLDAIKEKVAPWHTEGMVYVRHPDGRKIWYEACFLDKLPETPKLGPYRSAAEATEEDAKRGKTWFEAPWLLSCHYKSDYSAGILISLISSFKEGSYSDGKYFLDVKSVNGEEIRLYNFTSKEFIRLHKENVTGK